MPLKKATNPFYIVLVIVGVAFVLTTCMYLVATTRESVLQQTTADPVAAMPPWLEWIRGHGLNTLVAELVVLAVATFGAIVTDDYWSRRAGESSLDPKEPTDESESIRRG